MNKPTAPAKTTVKPATLKFKAYVKPAEQLMRRYVDGEDMTGITVSEKDSELKTLLGGMIAVNASNPKDMWYVGEAFFKENYVAAEVKGASVDKAMDVTHSSELPEDIKLFGNPDLWQLICKASGPNWMKSTKAMELRNLGCLVQVSTQINDIVAEAITFVPQVQVKKGRDGNPVLEY